MVCLFVVFFLFCRYVLEVFLRFLFECVFLFCLALLCFFLFFMFFLFCFAVCVFVFLGDIIMVFGLCECLCF